MSIRIETITHISQLTASIKSQWDALPLPSPMQSTDWLLTWWQTFGEGSSLQLQIRLIFADFGTREQLIAVAPFYLEDTWSRPKCLRFLGDDITCSDHATLIVEPAFEEEAVSALANQLIKECGTVWHSLRLESIDADNAVVKSLVVTLTAYDCELHTRDTDGCWTSSLPDAFDDYLAGLSKNHRKRCRRWLRTYFDSGRAEIFRRSGEEITHAWQEIAKLNMERRAAKDDRSAFLDERFQRFHQAVIPKLIAEGKCELRELYVDGKLKAAEYVLLHEGTMFCYQSGMTTDDNRDGYGNLSVLALFQDAIESDCTRFDFLRGDETYKQHWQTTRQPCVHYHVGAPSLKGIVHVALQRSRKWVRKVRDSLTSSSSA